MNEILLPLEDLSFLSALMALKPMSYVMRIGFAIAAFAAAMNVDQVIARVLGLVWLLITGGLLLGIGIPHGTVVDIVLGIAALAAAGYSWWFTRY